MKCIHLHGTLAYLVGVWCKRFFHDARVQFDHLSFYKVVFDVLYASHARLQDSEQPHLFLKIAVIRRLWIELHCTNKSTVTRPSRRPKQQHQTNEIQ
jgi:hypothetical protein